MHDVYFCGDDYLGLGTYGYNLRRIVENSDHIVRSNDNESFVIGIDAPWGTGKTYFLKMLENYLCGTWKNPGLDEDGLREAVERTGLGGEDDYTSINRVIYYDAWSNDFWNNAFEPFYETIINAIASFDGVDKDDLLSMAKALGRAISIGFDAYMHSKFGEPYEVAKKGIETVASEGSTLLETNNTDRIFSEYANFRDAVSGLKNLLNKVITQYKNLQSDRKIIIMIDELDRCKPLFSVQTLEIVKHFFNIPGLVFIFALDISQLKHCVKNVYGADFNAEGYLERFFNYLSNLPQGNYEPLIELFNVEASIKASNWKEISKPLISTYAEIAKRFSLSLRELKIVLSSLHTLEQTTLRKNTKHPYARILYFYFLSYKYKKPDDYKRCFLHGDMVIITNLLGNTDTQIPFSVYDKAASKSMIDNDINKNNTLLYTLGMKEKMRDFEMGVFDCFSNGKSFSDYFINNDKTNIQRRNGGVHILRYPETINYLLYISDFEDESVAQDDNRSEEETCTVLFDDTNVFEMTPLDYINKKIEMIKFL